MGVNSQSPLYQNVCPGIRIIINHSLRLLNWVVRTACSRNDNSKPGCIMLSKNYQKRVNDYY